MDAAYWQREFERDGNRLETWLHVAHDLMEAAEILMRSYRMAEVEAPNVLTFDDQSPEGLGVRSPALLLRAAVLEALFKGLAIRRLNHKFVEGGVFKRVPGTGNGHNLVALANVTKFPLSESEARLLDQMGAFLELGRFPTGTRWNVGLTEDPYFGLVRADEFQEISDGAYGRLLVRLHDAVTGKGES